MEIKGDTYSLSILFILYTHSTEYRKILGWESPLDTTIFRQFHFITGFYFLC